MTEEKPTKQIRDPKTGRILGGPPPNGFDQRPQDQGRGAWKKKDLMCYNNVYESRNYR